MPGLMSRLLVANIHYYPGVMPATCIKGRGRRLQFRLHPAIDEMTVLTPSQYQELFAVSQALPGPASTKMIFCIALIHAGLLPAIFVFLLWSMPGAVAMYGLSLGVQKMPTVLPPIVYALLSGMNASTVGIIALAAVQVSGPNFKKKMSRLIYVVSWLRKLLKTRSRDCWSYSAHVPGSATARCGISLC